MQTSSRSAGVFRSLKLSIALALATTAPATFAQDGPVLASTTDSLDEIFVTGSRIARPDLDRLQPTTVIGTDNLKERGFTNIAQALAEIPAFGVPGNGIVGTQDSSFAVGQSFVDFLGLGSQRTLTLVNGRRFVSSNTPSIFGAVDAGGQVDLNLIPVTLIDRIETIAVGGAPIYGSDAIAGTVNVILKKHYEGVETNFQYGMSTNEGDSEAVKVSGLAGTNFAGDRGNVILSLEYTDSKGLLETERRLTARQRSFLAPADESPFDLVLSPDFRIGLVNFAGLPMYEDFIPNFSGITDEAGNILTFSPEGNLIPYDVGAPTGSIVQNIGGDGLNFAPISNLSSPLTRKLATVLGTFDITENTRAFGEAWFSNTKGTRLASQPVYNTLLFGDAGTPDGNLIMSIDNPFLTQQARDLIVANLPEGQDVFYLARANSDLVSGRAEYEVDILRFVGGLEGDLNFGDRVFNWEVSANYGRSKGVSREPSLVEQNFLNAIDAVRDPESGEIVCASSLEPGGVVSAPVKTLSDTCAPLNVFGAGAPSREAVNYLTTIASTETVITQRVFSANIGGKLFDLPGGGVSAVLGYESRRESSEFTPDRFFREALGRSIPIEGLSGDFHTNEVFTELLVPLISGDQNVPFVHSLELEGAARYVDHSIAGAETTWTAGFRFAPSADVIFRGNFTRAIRAPAITEAFLPTAQAFETGNDPCDARYINQGPNPEQRAANCAAAGIVQPFTSDIVDFTVPVSVSGNQDLENEEANSWTVGFVLQPRWAEGFTLTADYINIDLTNAIVSLGAEDVMNACYDSSSLDNEFCARIDRDEDGQVTFLREGYGNAGSKKFKGYILDLSYMTNVPSFGRAPGSLGTLRFGMNYFVLNQLVTRVGTGDLNNEDGEIGYSRNQAKFDITYEKGAFSWLWEGIMLGSAVFERDEPEGTRDIPGVDTWFLFNSTLGYEVNEKLGVKLIVDNVFDKEPPFPSPGGGGRVTYWSGVLGRYVTMNVNYKF